MLHPIAEAPTHDVGILEERFRRGAVWPAALVLQGLRQVPMIERDVGSDAGVQKAIDEARVEVEALFIDGQSPTGTDARPRH